MREKVVLVTGGTRRIGESIVRTLHREGANIIVHYNSSSVEARLLEEELNGEREGSVELVQGKLTDLAGLKLRIRDVLLARGRLDALINNASVFYPTPVPSTTEDQWQEFMDVNAKAPYFLSQAMAPYLAKSKGAIINITDIYAGRPLAAHPVYCASKAALVSLTLSLAQELGPDIRVNGIAPGAIMWPENDMDELNQQRIVSQTPMKRAGNPDNIASTVKFLLCDNDFINGQIIRVDGGRTVTP